MDELISRQDAIEALANYEKSHGHNYSLFVDVVSECAEVIRDVPSVRRDTDEWCTDCKEYDHERHCCPRWNRVIRETMKDAQPDIAEGGTLTVTVPHGAEVGRVLVQEVGTTNGALYYRDAEEKS